MGARRERKARKIRERERLEREMVDGWEMGKEDEEGERLKEIKKE